jgi:hypothetical protein
MDVRKRAWIGICAAVFLLAIVARAEAFSIDEKNTLSLSAKAQTRASFRMQDASGYTQPAMEMGDLVQWRNLGIIEVGNYMRFWPLAVVAFGLAVLLESEKVAGRFAGAIVTLAGGLLLLNSIGIIRFRIWHFWPVVLILLGISIIWRGYERSRLADSDPSSTISTIAILGGLIGAFGISGATVAELKMLHSMFNPLLDKLSVSMLAWSVALIVATRVTNFIYPGANMFSSMGFAETKDIKSMLKNGWVVALCQILFLVIYSLLFV